jgi:RecJ-like exonuclease
MTAMKQERSCLWKRERTYSVVVQDDKCKILHRSKGINASSASKLLQDQKDRHRALSVRLCLDIHLECADCDGSGLWNVNKKLICPECEGHGTVIADHLGPDVTPLDLSNQ